MGAILYVMLSICWTSTRTLAMAGAILIALKVQHQVRFHQARLRRRRRLRLPVLHQALQHPHLLQVIALEALCRRALTCAQLTSLRNVLAVVRNGARTLLCDVSLRAKWV